MENVEKKEREYYMIDLSHIFKSLWTKSWLIVICGLIASVIGFSYSTYFITPQYSSSIMLYVNNSSFSLGNTSFSITSSEISAAQSLVKTYSELLKNRTTIESVIEKLDLPYSYGHVLGMIQATSSNETEIMKVTVTGDDPYEASRIANCIAEVLPARVSVIVDGASMEVVDYAVPNLSKISPNITRYTSVGFILGILISMLLVILAAMLDDTIHDEEYVIRTCKYPILARIPNLNESGSKKYGYYSYKKKKPKDTDTNGKQVL